MKMDDLELAPFFATLKKSGNLEISLFHVQNPLESIEAAPKVRIFLWWNKHVAFFVEFGRILAGRTYRSLVPSLGTVSWAALDGYWDGVLQIIIGNFLSSKSEVSICLHKTPARPSSWLYHIIRWCIPLGMTVSSTNHLFPSGNVYLAVENTWQYNMHKWFCLTIGYPQTSVRIIVFP